MIKRFGVLAAIVLFVGAIMFATEPRADWLMTGAVLTSGILFVALTLTPAVRRAAQNNGRLFVVGGISLIVVGIGVLAAGIFYAPFLTTDATVAIFSLFLLLGLLLIMLPQMSARMDRAVAEQARMMATPPIGVFEPISEVKSSLAQIASNPAILVRVFGPWFVVFCVLCLLSALFTPELIHSFPNSGNAMGLLLALVLALTLMLGLFLRGLVLWTRFAATGQKPGLFELEGLALWRWLWRVVVFGAIFSRGLGLIEGLFRGLAQSSPWAAQTIDKIVLLAALIAVSPFFVSLPSLALNSPISARMAAVRAVRDTQRKFYLGAALILLPYVVLSWIVDGASTARTTSASLDPAVIAVSLVAFVTAVVLMTYVTRVFARTESADNAAVFA